MVAGDFTGSGKQDLAVATYSGSVDIFLGNGDGTFKAAASLALPGTPSAMVTADLRNDGKLDLAVLDNVNNTTGYVTVFLGNGNGTFATGVSYPVDFTDPNVIGYGLGVGDFTNNGNLDLVVTGQDYTMNNGYISVLYGVGDGTFRTIESWVYGGLLSAVAVAAFKNTGQLDFAVTDPLDGVVTAAVVTAPVPNGAVQIGPLNAYPVQAAALAIGDFNGNGIADIALLQDSAFLSPGINSTEVTILTGNGDGTFATGAAYAIPWLANDLEVADLSADGTPDILEVNTTGNNVGLLLGNGNGTFGNGPNFSVGDLPTDAAVADFTGDGALDVAVVNFVSGTVSVLLHQTVSGSVTVSINPAAPSQFAVTAPSGATPGTAFLVTVTAEDSFGNTTTGYTGAVHFTSSDLSATLPGSRSLTNGVGTFTRHPADCRESNDQCQRHVEHFNERHQQHHQRRQSCRSFFLHCASHHHSRHCIQRHRHGGGHQRRPYDGVLGDRQFQQQRLQGSPPS